MFSECSRVRLTSDFTQLLHITDSIELCTALLVANLYARDMTGAVPDLAKACFELYSNKSFQTLDSDSISWTAPDQHGFYDLGPFSRSQESRAKQKVIVFHFFLMGIDWTGLLFWSCFGVIRCVWEGFTVLFVYFLIPHLFCCLAVLSLSLCFIIWLWLCSHGIVIHV